MEENFNEKKKTSRFRLDIMLVLSFFVLLISFCAYMINTSLEDVLNSEFDSSITTHDYTFDSSQE